MKLLSGTSNQTLAGDIARALDIPLTATEIQRFADNEVFVRIDENVRGEDVFVIQSTSYPANDHLMELLICIDALVRASAARITAVIPYFGYARQDRKVGGRTPISAKLVANMIVTAGANRVLTLDLHAGQIQGFFDVPTDNLYAVPVVEDDIRKNYDVKDLMIVSPDVGGVVLGVPDEVFEAIITARRKRIGVESDAELGAGEIISRPVGATCTIISQLMQERELPPTPYRIPHVDVDLRPVEGTFPVRDLVRQFCGLEGLCQRCLGEDPQLVGSDGFLRVPRRQVGLEFGEPEIAQHHQHEVEQVLELLFHLRNRGEDMAVVLGEAPGAHQSVHHA